MPAMSVPMRVRWSDLDPLGHVNNVRMLEFVQESRVVMLERVGIFDRHDSAAATLDFTQVVARQEINYRLPLFLHSNPTVTTHVTRIGRSSYDLAFEIRTADGQLAADGTTVLVVVGVASGAAVEIPDDFRGVLEGFQI